MNLIGIRPIEGADVDVEQKPTLRMRGGERQTKNGAKYPFPKIRPKEINTKSLPQISLSIRQHIKGL